jgi:integrase
MYLSKRSNGIYYIFYRQENGKMTCKSTKEKIKSKAIEFLFNFQAEIKVKREPIVAPIPIRKFFGEFLTYSESIHSPQHTGGLKATFSKFIQHLGNPLLSQVRKEDFIRFYEIRLREVSPHSVKRDLAHFSVLFNWGISKGYIKQNLVQGIKKPRLPERLPLFFDEAGYQTLLKNMDNKDLSDIVQFAVNTGLRKSELIRLEWTQVNLNEKYLILDNRNYLTKSRKVRTVPLNTKAVDILTERQKQKIGNNVFTLRNDIIKSDYLYREFKRIVIKSNLNNKLHFHSLRHTFASWLVQKNVPIQQVQQLLGHSDLKTTLIYSHLRVEDLLNSVNKLNN